MMFQTAVVGSRGVKFILFRFANQVDRQTGLRPNPNLRQPYYVDNSQGCFDRRQTGRSYRRTSGMFSDVASVLLFHLHQRSAE